MRASVLKAGQVLRSHFYGKESCTITSHSQTHFHVEAACAIISPKKKWNKDEVDEVKRLFPLPTVSIKDIKEKVQLCNVDASRKQIYNKLHSLARYSPSIEKEIDDDLRNKLRVSAL